MDIDVLITGVTGFVGRFILLELIEKYPHTKIGVIIRPFKEKQPVQRFHEEIIQDTMFSKYHDILTKINIISASIEDIEKTSMIIKSVHSIIHCAANVKHYDPYDKLIKDNVNNIKIILKLGNTLKCKRLILLSTCYVHPKNMVTNGENKRIPKMPRDAFYNDYCYTKWLGEEAVFDYSMDTSMEIHIARLSCVGAPLRMDLLSHPFSAQAHLGILSLASRGYLSAIGLQHNARLSIIPVDLVSRYIIDIYKKDIIGDTCKLHQICPPKTNDTFHPNLINIFSIAQYELGITGLRTVIHDGESSNYLPPWYSFLRIFSKKADQYVSLHDKIQEFVLLFTSNDIRFDSSLPHEYFDDQCLLLDTYNYSIRTAQHLQFKKGVPLSLTDKFWHKIANKEPVQLCCKFTKPINISEIETLKQNIWSLMCSNRKFSCVVENNTWIYKPGMFNTHFSCMEFDGHDSIDESILLIKGLNKYTIDNIWHCDFVVCNNMITHGLLQFDHGITDGIGLIQPIVNKVDNYMNEWGKEGNKGNKGEPVRTHRNLNMFQEIVFGLIYCGILIASLLFNNYSNVERVTTPSISTGSVPIVKHSKFTFTTDILWKLTQTLARHTQHNQFILCVPSVISVNRAANEIMNNNFVPILLPVSATMSEEEFKGRCDLMKSKAVIFIMYCIQQLISMRDWWWLRDSIMSKVTAIVSSINLGSNMPASFSSVHVATTTPSPIPFCITAVSDMETSFITVRSHNPTILSSVLLSELI
jgi:thioester reductase-like protein